MQDLHLNEDNDNNDNNGNDNDNDNNNDNMSSHLNYTDEQLLGHLADLTASQMATVNISIRIDDAVALIGPRVVTTGEGTSESLTDLAGDIKNRTASELEDLGDTSVTGGWGTIVDGLPA